VFKFLPFGAGAEGERIASNPCFLASSATTRHFSFEALMFYLRAKNILFNEKIH